MKVGRKNARIKEKEKSLKKESKDDDVDEDEEEEIDKDDILSEQEAPLKTVFIVLFGNGIGLIVFFWEARKIFVLTMHLLRLKIKNLF